MIPLLFIFAIIFIFDWNVLGVRSKTILGYSTVTLDMIKLIFRKFYTFRNIRHFGKDVLESH